MSELKSKLSERIKELEDRMLSLGNDINSQEKSLQEKRIELDNINKELKILLKARDELKNHGL